MPTRPDRTIAVIGLGYVGLPLVLAFAKAFPTVIGFDINAARVNELKKGVDRTGEATPKDLTATRAVFTTKAKDIAACDVYIVTVPTPIHADKTPDLAPVRAAAETVGQVLKKGDIVVLESTVYPGVTEEIMGPILARVSGLTAGEDFFLGYSPERINPGDPNNRLDTIVKVVAGDTPHCLETLSALYGAIISAGIFKAASIKTAEAAKVIENTQRDVNIALMNELSLIFDRLGLRTRDVLDAASTKWNFLRFSPGLVGGHCIGVDPYYLTTKATEVGYHPEVILSGRRINDGMGAFIAQKTVKMMLEAGKNLTRSTVGIFGITFKENVPDIRNSRVPDIVRELHTFGINPRIHDPLADAAEVAEEYGFTLNDATAFKNLDALILAVPHTAYVQEGAASLRQRLAAPQSVLVDIKSAFSPADFSGHRYWSL